MTRLARYAAALVVDLAAALMPSHLRHWGCAMRHEVRAIERGALPFALGCLGGALIETFRPLLLSSRGSIAMRNSLPLHTRGHVAACAIAATTLGLAYMAIGGAPVGYMAMNLGALLIGFLAVGIVTQVGRLWRVPAGAIAIVLGLALLATAIGGASADGATRWIRLGGLAIQPSLILLPVLALGYARSPDRLSTLGIVIAAAALAIQPDRAMAGALAFGMAALAIARPGRNVLIALAASATGFAAAMLQPDVEPAMPWVDQILYSAFDVHPVAGLAVLGGSIVLLLPALTGYLSGTAGRETHLVFGAVWLAIVAAAALGNYPTPLVGFGGSAILGYLLSMTALPRRADPAAAERDSAPAAPGDAPAPDLRMAIG